ncbi:GntR family transcriptional regulator [Pacificispira sp.]|uniref:GntR family transcriptional regulator n=1 Tax=Pacificispira sp. TaxID=2888761 RepID=UPI003B52C20A
MSQTQRAVRDLREMIVNNHLPPGSNYLETELAEMLGMSRTPVREAVIVLESQGLVESRPRRGVRVLPLSARDMEEIYEVLTELEAHAAERAASAPIKAADREAVETALRDMDLALARDDREAWAEADKRFHDLLVQLAGNGRLSAIVDSFNDQVHRARMLTVRLRPSPTKSNQDHRDLFNAILAGDAAKARALHVRHRTEAKNLIIGLLESHGFHQV